MNNVDNKERTYRPKLRFYHPNGKCTGCAIQMELLPAHGSVDGAIMLKASNQISVGNQSGTSPVYPRFDWENGITVKLDFSDLCRILQVLRGDRETLENDRGLFHRSARNMTRIILRRLSEPLVGSYAFELYRKTANGEDSHTHIVFSPWEALGLAEAISGSLSVVSFGLPVVLASDNANNDNERRFSDHGSSL